ncbi:MAG: methyl-accepting chemotaxis protein [Deltaproteobacteria bacterium]|jgi:methyl-accepting chemotaxis protein|nr:methyl-accepting chemotaxis protein [Deltaproteobacteria bacterium]MDA8304454.1 methyl-accepting chemotaxis protein [Deltaproteobacteria bacterium]
MKGGLNFVKKVSIKAKLLFLIIFVFILILSFLTYYSVSSQNKMSVKMTSADAVITAKTMLSSLNAMMLNGTISKKSDRRQLFKIFKKIQGIKDVKVIRGEAVDKEFGPGLKQENPTTGFDKEILGSNKEIISIFNKNGHEYLKVGVPFVAKKMSRGINCLMCHTVKDGTTLGGVKLIYSMKNAVSSSDIFMRNIIIVSAIFLVLSILAIYGLLKSIFIKPTKNLYDKLNDIVRGDGDLSKLLPMDCYNKATILIKKSKNCMLSEGELEPRCWDKQQDRYGDAGGQVCVKCDVYKNSVYDEITSVANKFNKFIIDIREIVKSITEEAMTIVDVNTSIETHVDEISDKAKEQALLSTHVAAASEEMSQTIKEISKNTQNLSNVAKEASSSAKEGFDIVERAITGIKNVAVLTEELGNLINGLEKGSYEIGEIISVINDIADQTNLLALNAAIEAARAGESGRGFAVVADEVRKLAERTVKATKEIVSKVQTIQQSTQNTKSSMDSTMKEVGLSVEYASKAGESLNSIERNIIGLADQVNSIAAASEEQTAATNEISQNIEMVSNLAASNSEASENTAKEAASVYGELEKLIGIIKRFKY